MKILVLNSGSSSIKFHIFEGHAGRARGILERVGTPEATLRIDGGEGAPPYVAAVAAPDHTAALEVVLAAVDDSGIAAVGHRVVHGGAEIAESRLIDAAVIDVIERHAPLAPLHNPANLAGIEVAMAALPTAAHVAVFDTAFLATLPPRAYRYAVPLHWYRDHQVRKYGFHGTSHRFVTERAADLLGKPTTDVNLVTCHLGNGASVTAVAGGRAVDHSMGMTPLAGLVMGTRSGDVDPAVVLHMIERGMSPAEVGQALNEDSGMLALSEGHHDVRDLIAAAEAGNEAAKLALDVFVYRLAKYIGAYAAVVPSLDAVVLTGGAGENAAPLRARVAETLTALGIELDPAANATLVRGAEGRLTTPESRLAIWCISTDEELLIARDTARLAGDQ